MILSRIKKIQNTLVDISGFFFSLVSSVRIIVFPAVDEDIERIFIFLCLVKTYILIRLFVRVHCPDGNRAVGNDNIYLSEKSSNLKTLLASNIELAVLENELVTLPDTILRIFRDIFGIDSGHLELCEDISGPGRFPGPRASIKID